MENPLPEAVKQLRAAVGGISQETLAHRIGTTVRTVARWEKGDSIPVESLARLHQVAVQTNDLELINIFQAGILVRLHLDYEFEDFIPQTVTEMLLVGELLRRFRRSGSGIEPIVDQLFRWVSEHPRYKQLTLKEMALGENEQFTTLRDLMNSGDQQRYKTLSDLVKLGEDQRDKRITLRDLMNPRYEGTTLKDPMSGKGE